jgi:predicted dinucleotide-binding enzyme
LDVFITGDDAGPRPRVSSILKTVSLRPLDIGDLKAAHRPQEASLLSVQAGFGEAVTQQQLAIDVSVRG